MDFFNEALYSTDVRITKPDTSLFQVPPRGDPITLPPATTGISPDLYNAALNVKVPITIAFLYAVTVTFLNAYNKSTGYKAWSISRTKAFFVFVVLHNVFLAVYSGWTFVGMFKGLKRSLESSCRPSWLRRFSLQDTWSSGAWKCHHLQYLDFCMGVQFGFSSPDQCWHSRQHRCRTLMERRSCILWLVLLPIEILRSPRHSHHSCQGQEILYPSDVSPCRRYVLYVGRH
jgi:hypothetical protein